MTYPTAISTLFSLLFFSSLMFYIYRSYQRRSLYRKLARMPFPDSWRTYLNRTRHYPSLDPQQRERIERALLRFVYTKSFAGIGMEVTEEMKVIVAFHAALMTLNLSGYDYPSLHTILFYADDFIADEHHEAGGIVTETPDAVLEGQSSQESIALSWPDVIYETRHHTGANLVIHECAHILDFEMGLSTPGANPWHQTFQRLFTDYERAFDRPDDKQQLLGDYAAVNTAEFFAVASERFFEAPLLFQRDFPELYTLLENFYGTPATIHPPYDE